MITITIYNVLRYHLWSTLSGAVSNHTWSSSWVFFAGYQWSLSVIKISVQTSFWRCARISIFRIIDLLILFIEWLRKSNYLSRSQFSFLFILLCCWTHYLKRVVNYNRLSCVKKVFSLNFYIDLSSRIHWSNTHFAGSIPSFFETLIINLNLFNKLFVTLLKANTSRMRKIFCSASINSWHLFIFMQSFSKVYFHVLIDIFLFYLIVIIVVYNLRIISLMMIVSFFVFVFCDVVLENLKLFILNFFRPRYLLIGFRHYWVRRWLLAKL